MLWYEWMDKILSTKSIEKKLKLMFISIRICLHLIVGKRNFKSTKSACINGLLNNRIIGTGLKDLEEVFVEESNYPK